MLANFIVNFKTIYVRCKNKKLLLNEWSNIKNTLKCKYMANFIVFQKNWCAATRI